MTEDIEEKKDIKYVLKKAKKSDIVCLKKFKLDTILEHASNISKEEMNRIKNYVNTQVTSEIDNFQLIMVNNKIIGCLLVISKENGVLLDTIYIVKEYRNLGIGTDIIKKVLKTHKNIYLWVYKENHKAVELYQKLRFEIIEETESRYYMNALKGINE